MVDRSAGDVFKMSGLTTRRHKEVPFFFLIKIECSDEDGALWGTMIFLSDVVVLPQTEKVLRNLFASAEEVPHVLRSFFHQGRQVRTKGHLFKTRDNALHQYSVHQTCNSTSTLRHMRIDTRFFHVRQP